MKVISTTVVLLFFFLPDLILFSQPSIKNNQFRHLSTQNGLSQSIVHCIFQDHRGFIWCGAYDGLNMYDGVHFRVFRHVPGDRHSLGSSIVKYICQDKQNRLWVGTYGGGLNLFNRDNMTFTQFLLPNGAPAGEGNEQVNTLYLDCGGILWVGTNAGLSKIILDIDNKDKYNYLKWKPGGGSALSGLSVLSIFEDSRKRLWVATKNGLNLLGDDKQRVEKWYFGNFAPEFEIRLHSKKFNVNGLLEDKNNTLWAATNHGLYRFDYRLDKLVLVRLEAPPLPAPDSLWIWSIAEGPHGNLWLGTRTHGLIILNPATGDFEPVYPSPKAPDTLQNGQVMSLFKDRSGLMWIGTGDGIDIYDGKKKLLDHYCRKPGQINGLNNNSIWSICEDVEGILWVGTGGGGLNRFDRGNNKWQAMKLQAGNPASLSHDFVYSILEDRNNVIWVATMRGLNRLDKRNFLFKRYLKSEDSISGPSDNFIYKILENPDGNLWLGTKGGLNLMFTQNNTFRHYHSIAGVATTLSSDSVTDLLLDRSGRLWIGTSDGGLNRLVDLSGVFRRYPLNCNDVRSLFEDYEGTIWAGTAGGGLNRLHPGTGEFTAYTIEQGLPDNFIYAILEDESHNLWISTNKGIARFSPGTGNVRVFDLSENIQGYEFNSRASFKSAKGEMFFGGLKGFNSFFPGTLTDNTSIPPVVITGLQVLQSSRKNNPSLLRRVPVTDKRWELSYRDNIFALHYAALDYTEPGKNRYQYKLEGFTEGWINQGNQTKAVFTKLEPGKYVFRVRGSNNDGVWNKQGDYITLVITPPFWKTIWFQAICLLAVLLAAFKWHKWRLKQQELLIRSREEMRNLVIRYNFSNREQEIIKLVLQGKSNKEIEDELFIALKTVKSHLYNIYRKTNVKNRLELINKIQLTTKN